MTEDEAKAKWCPMRVPNGSTIDSPKTASCIGSSCMAWRKIPGASKFKDARTGQLSDRDLTGHGTWVYDGFCGLAGAPQ